MAAKKVKAFTTGFYIYAIYVIYMREKKGDWKHEGLILIRRRCR
jgi:hypothetical protein